jgi:hypothetical protein
VQDRHSWYGEETLDVEAVHGMAREYRVRRCADRSTATSIRRARLAQAAHRAGMDNVTSLGTLPS